MKRFWSKWSKLTQIYVETFGLGPNCDHQSWSRDFLGLGEITFELYHGDSPCSIWIYSKPLLVEVE